MPIRSYRGVEAQSWFIAGASFDQVMKALASPETLAAAYPDAQPGDSRLRHRAYPGAAFYTHGGTESDMVRVEYGPTDHESVLSALRASGLEVSEAPAQRKPGRPRIHQEPRDELRIRLPVALVEAIRASGESLTGYVEQAVREKLDRDSEKQTGAETGGSAHH